MCSNIHHVPKYGVTEGNFKSKEPWVIISDVFSAQTHQAGGGGLCTVNWHLKDSLNVYLMASWWSEMQEKNHSVQN